MIRHGHSGKGTIAPDHRARRNRGQSGPARPIQRWGSIWPTWPSPGFLNNDDIKLFMDEVIPHFA